MIELKLLLLAGGDHAIVHKSIIAVGLMWREICMDIYLNESDLNKKTCKDLRCIEPDSIGSITD